MIQNNRRLAAQRASEIKVGVITLFVVIIVVSISNIDLLKADANAGKMINFRVEYGVTEDCGLTIVTNDGHVWDMKPSKAKYFADGAHVEITFDDMGTKNKKDDMILKVKEVR